MKYYIVSDAYSLLQAYMHTLHYTVFHKLRTHLFSFYNFTKRWSIVIKKIISLCNCRICVRYEFTLPTAMFLLTELQDLQHASA